MIQVKNNQIKLMAQAIFLENLEHAFCRDIQGFGELTSDERDEFLEACLSVAESRGLVTEQGVASYALASWWLGIGFEEKSSPLLDILATQIPEVRKVHAMNEWSNVLIGDPDNIAKADERLRESLVQTEAWGS